MPMPTQYQRTDRRGVDSDRLATEGLAVAMETVLQRTQVATLNTNYRLRRDLPLVNNLNRRYL